MADLGVNRNNKVENLKGLCILQQCQCTHLKISEAAFEQPKESVSYERVSYERVSDERVSYERVSDERVSYERMSYERVSYEIRF